MYDVIYRETNGTRWQIWGGIYTRDDAFAVAQQLRQEHPEWDFIGVKHTGDKFPGVA